MARGRRGGAWGNALGGFRRQRRDYYGRFSGAGVVGSVPNKGSRAVTPTFTKGKGTPRYYAPGGKTYSLTRGGPQIAASTPAAYPKLTKAQRRYQAYQKAATRKETERKTARRKKAVRVALVGAAGAAAVVGGGLAYRKYGSGGPLTGGGRPSGHTPGAPGGRPGGGGGPKPPVKPLIPLGPATIRRSLVAGDSVVAGRLYKNYDTKSSTGTNDPVKRAMAEARAQAAAQGKAPRPGPTVNSAASPGKDNGHSPAQAKVIKAIGAGGVAISAAKNAADTVKSVEKTIHQVRALPVGKDGVADRGRYKPKNELLAAPLDDTEALMALNMEQNLSYKSLHQYWTMTPPSARITKTHKTVETRQDTDPDHVIEPRLRSSTMGGPEEHKSTTHSWEKLLLTEGVNVPEVGQNIDKSGDPVAVQPKRGPSQPTSLGGDVVGSGFTVRDVHQIAPTKQDRIEQAKFADQISGGQGKWVKSKEDIEKLVAERKARPTISMDTAAQETFRRVTNTPPPPSYHGVGTPLNKKQRRKIQAALARESEQRDLEIAQLQQRSQRRQNIRQISDRVNEAFPASNMDQPAYDKKGRLVGESNYNADQYTKDARLIRQTNQPDPIRTAELTAKQEAQIIQHMRKGREIQPYRTPHTTIRPTTRIYKEHERAYAAPKNEAEAQRWLDQMNQLIAGGHSPTPEEQWNMKWIEGQRLRYWKAPPQKTKEDYKKENRRKRAAARKAGQ